MSTRWLSQMFAVYIIYNICQNDTARVVGATLWRSSKVIFYSWNLHFINSKGSNNRFHLPWQLAAWLSGSEGKSESSRRLLSESDCGQPTP